jgi:hypothetical protein
MIAKSISRSFGDQLFQQRILRLELLEPPHVVRLETTEPLTPRVDRLLADPVPLGPVPARDLPRGSSPPSVHP